MAELGRQSAHVFYIDIRRIADDQVVLLALEIIEEIGLHQTYAIDEAMPLDVYRGNSERLCGDIDRINRGIGKRFGDGDRDAGAASTKIYGAGNGIQA